MSRWKWTLQIKSSGKHEKWLLNALLSSRVETFIFLMKAFCLPCSPRSGWVDNRTTAKLYHGINRLIIKKVEAAYAKENYMLGDPGKVHTTGIRIEPRFTHASSSVPIVKRERQMNKWLGTKHRSTMYCMMWTTGDRPPIVKVISFYKLVKALNSASMTHKLFLDRLGKIADKLKTWLDNILANIICLKTSSF